MSDYAQNIPTCDEWTRANAPEALKNPITYWPQWYGDTPAYAPWARQIDERLAQLVAHAQSAPVRVIAVFKDKTDGPSFVASDEYRKLIAAYLEKRWHLVHCMCAVDGYGSNVYSFELNTDTEARLCPLLRAKQ